MPCYDPRDHEPLTVTELLVALEDRFDDEMAKVDSLTAMLCDVGRAVYRNKPFPQEVKEWWVKHLKEDIKRGMPW